MQVQNTSHMGATQKNIHEKIDHSSPFEDTLTIKRPQPKGENEYQGINSLDPGFSTSLTICVIPALYPRKAVNLQGFDGSSFGKALTVFTTEKK